MQTEKTQMNNKGTDKYMLWRESKLPWLGGSEYVGKNK